MPQPVSAPSFATELASPGTDLGQLAKHILREPELLQTLFHAIDSRAARTRFAGSKLLQLLSQESPQILYPYFDALVAMLRSTNSIIRWNASLALGNLASADTENKLDRILEEYLAPISGPQMIDAANTVRGATAIALAKPYLADRIARAIRSVERAHYATPECRNVALGHAILALQRIFPLLHDQRAAELFARRQRRNPRNATRNKARVFARKCHTRTAGTCVTA
jgi:hypothetical protein